MEWYFSLKDQGRLAYEKTAGIKFNVGMISNDVTKAILLTTTPQIAKKVMFTNGLFKNEMGCEYTPLAKDNGVVTMSYDIEERMMNNARKARYTEEGVKNFLFDYCKVGRMRQELTIDYAKRLTDLSGIESLLLENTIALGMKQHTISYDSAKLDNPIEIKFMTEREASARSKNKKIIISDPMDKLQIKCMDYASRSVMGENGMIRWLQEHNSTEEDKRYIELERQLQDQKAQRLFLEIKRIYKDAVGGIMNLENNDERIFDTDDEDQFSESEILFKDVTKRLENMLRLGTEGMNPIERARKLKAISRGKNYEQDCRENKLYLQICKEEYLLWLCELGFNDIDFIGEKLYDETMPREDKLKAGDIIEFCDGECIDGKHQAFIEVAHSGKLEIFEKNGILYAGKKLVDSIIVPTAEKKITVPVHTEFFKNQNAKQSYEIINDRAHNKCKVAYSENDQKWYMFIRNCNNKMVRVPIFLDESVGDKIKDDLGYIVGTRLNTVKSSNGIDVPVIYIDIDFD